MPLTQGSRALQTYYPFVGEELPKSHSYQDWLAKRGLTQSSLTAESSNTGVMTVSTETAAAGVFIGEVQFLAPGEANLVLTLSAGGRVKKTVFKYIVSDAKAV